MALFTLTINNFGTALDKQNHEIERIHRYLKQANQDLRGGGGKKTSGTIYDAGGVTVVGSWTYAPQAAS